jgi:hypothetical protein
MSRRAWHICTVILVMALASYTIWRSTLVLGFALAERETSAAAIEPRLSPYFDEPETGVPARLDALADNEDLDPARKIEAISQLLALEPLASRAWLELASARLGVGAGVDTTAASLRMSAVTGPNESAIMAGRALFALPLWAGLPEDLHRRTITDLIGGQERLEASDWLVMMLTLSAAPAIMRADLGSMLQLSGEPGASVATKLGLTPKIATKQQAPTP